MPQAWSFCMAEIVDESKSRIIVLSSCQSSAYTIMQLCRYSRWWSPIYQKSWRPSSCHWDLRRRCMLQLVRQEQVPKRLRRWKTATWFQPESSKFGEPLGLSNKIVFERSRLLLARYWEVPIPNWGTCRFPISLHFTLTFLALSEEIIHSYICMG